MTICVEACFQARPSNKNICFVIFVLGNIDVWLHHNKIFSFKIKKSIVARYEYIMNSLKIPSTIESWNYFGSVGQLLKPQNICSGNIIQVQRTVLDIQPNISNKMSFHAKFTPCLGTFSLQEIYNNHKTKSENTVISRMG